MTNKNKSEVSSQLNFIKNMSYLRRESYKTNQRSQTIQFKHDVKRNVIVEENENTKKSISPYRKTREEADERFEKLYPAMKKKRERQNRILAMLIKNTRPT